MQFSKIIALLTLSFFVTNKNTYGTAPEIILYNIGYLTSNNYKDKHAKPLSFPTTNNLRRKNGSPFLAKGEPLVIYGKVVDLADAPIENVKIKIWQANHFGYYNYLVDKDDYNKHDPDFLSAGYCVTDNTGHYVFTTIMPGFYGLRTPHIHIIVEHSDFDTIELEMIFPNHPRNKTDPKISSLKSRERQLITCQLEDENPDAPNQGKTAIFKIRLNGLHRTRHD
ncbi:MAG: hypothetical protein JJW01_01250 [Alphaproteobacteria bacterium]|nr:hypothetical protein [Rickettsiales bacterium]